MSEVINLRSAEQVREDYLTNYPISFVVDPAVIAAIADVRNAGHAVVIVTNGPPFQEQVIRSTGLDQHTDGWVVSELEGFRKPDVRIIERIRQKHDRGDVAVIGDGIADIELAHNLGAPGIWIHRGRTWDTNLAFSPSDISDSAPDALRSIAAPTY